MTDSLRIPWKGPVIKQWSWPLSVGVYSTSSSLVKEINMGHWAKELCPVEKVSNSKPKYDLLLIETISQGEELLRQGNVKFTAKLVLIPVERNVAVGGSEEVREIALQIAKKLNATGIVLFYSTFSLPEWYERFVIELSHNKPVVKAVQDVPNTKLRAYGTTGLANAKLSTSVREFLEGIKNLKLPAAGRITVRRRMDAPVLMSISEAVNYLRNNLKSLPYTHESGTASTIAQLRKALAKAVNQAKKVSRETDSFTFGPSRGERPLKTKKRGSSSWTNTGGPAAKKAVKKKAVKKKKFRSAKKAVKKAAKKSISKGSTSAPTKPKQPKAGQVASYLQAAFRKPGKKETETQSLLPSQKYHLYVKIGEADIEFIPASISVDPSAVFTQPNVREVTIGLEIRLNTQTKVLYGSLTWSRGEDSDQAKFTILTPKLPQRLEADIIAYHGNKQIQRALLSIAIRKESDKSKIKPATFKVQAALRTNFNQLEARNKFDTVIATSGETDDSRPMAGRSKGQALSFTDSDSLKGLVNKIKKRLEDAAVQSFDGQSLDSPESLAVLIPLANQGALLFQNYLGNLSLDGPLQLINNTGNYLPLDFAYTRQAPNENAKMCEHAVAALEAGKCKGCIKNLEEERTQICPFGFWAISQIVERHVYKPSKAKSDADFILQSIPGQGKKTLQVLRLPLHGSSSRVDNAKRGLRKQVRDFIEGQSGQLAYAKDWKQWSAAIPQNPDSLILIVHVEPNEVTDVDMMELGTAMLDHTQLDNKYIPPATTDKAPFVILIGCEASNTDHYIFDTVSSFFKAGAAIVISNFTTIAGDQAAALVMELVEVIKKEAGTAVSFGEVMLRVRRQLMAKGILAGLSLLAHGDTQWKIKS